jgi:hypothetical protein
MSWGNKKNNITGKAPETLESQQDILLIMI